VLDVDAARESPGEVSLQFLEWWWAAKRVFAQQGDQILSFGFQAGGG
jgi:hypothetical protein